MSKKIVQLNEGMIKKELKEMARSTDFLLYMHRKELNVNLFLLIYLHV